MSETNTSQSTESSKIKSDFDVIEFFCQFQDFMASKIDVYEQAIYLYLFRHSRLIGKNSVVVGFKSERTRLATGVGENGKPMAEHTAYLKLTSLAQRGFLNIIDTTHKGKHVSVLLPHEIPNLISEIEEVSRQLDLEDMDFFNDPVNRVLILKRENYRCFYTLKKLTAETFVVEHVVSRPDGNNGYRNCVAASREANNKKGSLSAEDFIRSLYRDDYLNTFEFQGRMRALQELQDGLLKPPL